MSTLESCPVIAKMTKADVDAVHEIECASFITPWSKKALSDELKNNLAYYAVMRIEKTAVAFAGMWVYLGEAHITNVAVNKPYRGNGYGRLIMKHMMNTARNMGAERMTLEVRENNITAQNLYNSLGFYREGLRRRYYEDTGEDAIIMWVAL